MQLLKTDVKPIAYISVLTVRISKNPINWMFKVKIRILTLNIVLIW
jgi:hypothetical protein